MSSKDRKDPRTKVLSMTVRYRSASVDDFIENHSHDVSTGGMFIKTKSPFPPGTLLKFEVKIAEDQRVLQGVGRVVWKREPLAASEEFPAGMGIKFIRLDDDTRNTVERLTHNRMEPESAFEEGARREGVMLSSVPPPLAIGLPTMPGRDDSLPRPGNTLPTRPSVTAAAPSHSPLEKKASHKPSAAPPLSQKGAGLGVVRIPQISQQPRLPTPSLGTKQPVKDDIDAMLDAAISPTAKPVDPPHRQEDESLPTNRPPPPEPMPGRGSDSERPSTPWVRRDEGDDRETSAFSPHSQGQRASQPPPASFRAAPPAEEEWETKSSRPPRAEIPSTPPQSTPPESAPAPAPVPIAAASIAKTQKKSTATTAKDQPLNKAAKAAIVTSASPQKGGTGKTIGLLLAIVVLGGGLYFLVLGGSRIAEPLPAPAVVAPEPPPAEPVKVKEPEPSPEAPPAPSPPAEEVAEPQGTAGAAAEAAPSAAPAASAVPEPPPPEPAPAASAPAPVPKKAAPAPRPRPAPRPAPPKPVAPAPAEPAPAEPAPAPEPAPPPAPKPAPKPAPAPADDNPY